MRKKEPIIFYEKPKLNWLILKGRRKLCPTPYVYVMPDLKFLKQKP